MDRTDESRSQDLMHQALTPLGRTRTKPLVAVLSAAALGAALLSAGSASAQERQQAAPDQGRGRPSAEQALVLQWFDVTKQTVAAAAFAEPVTQSRAWAVSWLAASRAVQEGATTSFQQAALATALHDTLVAQVPSQQAQLDAALTATLATVPAGKQKEQGVAAGHDEASDVLASRAGDGLDTASVDVAWAPPTAAPGVWQPTPPSFGPAVRAGQKDGKAFLLTSNDQFRPGPPPALSSPEFQQALAEIRAVGQNSSATRTAAQTDTANFIAQDSYALYGQVLRAVLADTNHSLRWDARAVAAFHVVTVDAQIAIFDAKYTYTFWRPVTAIRNDPTDPDTTWTPLLATPRHPEYPSGHAGYAGAASAVLTWLTGPTAPEPVSVTASTAPGSVHTYTRWSQITQETIDGRVWEGVHFRFSDETAARVGRTVAAWDLSRLHQLGL
jgi:hypothetical protein